MASWEIVAKATEFISEEMGVALKRSAISPNIRERMDHSCAILDTEGNIVAQAEHIPVHLGSFRIGSRNIVSWLNRNSMILQEGDMLIVNDPYISGTHLNDVTIIAPIYFEGDLSGYVINKAHNVDVGGPVFGSLNPSASTLFEEGLVIPPSRFLINDKVNKEVLNFITENFKDADTAIGDLNAQMAANRSGIRRVTELFRRYGKAFVHESWNKSIEHTNRLSLLELKNWNKGVFEAIDYLERNDEKVPVRVSLEVKENGIKADFTGSSDQVDFPINAVIGVTYSATAFAIRSFMKSEIPTNEGFYRVLEIIAPEGCIVNPRKPAAVSGGNVETTQRVADVVLAALSKCMPDRAVAASSGTMMNIMMGGRRKNGKFWSYYETVGGGNGGRPTGPGVSGVHSNMTNTLNTPVEIAEKEYPLLFTTYKLRDGSGGKGLHSGGDGVIRGFKVMLPTKLSIIADRFKVTPSGAHGGESGKTGEIDIIHNGEKKEMPSKFSFSLDSGDEVIIRTPGGGGFGSLPHRQ
ncbi:MAG: hydantoinase B/oxoprolinase family protein [Candidatus Thermoplasmatota archaeon]|nr:hydantoinase B/oxoprolinase family protein [Candidatus Thermoplasmatota archaeon]MDA8144184.1 hydantoinase B/oxoprolinase family protein [Thermoplasmatales archaeon]